MKTRGAHARERGATAVTVALFLVVLCPAVGLLWNIGHMMSMRSQLQNATDTAALAAAQVLDGTTDRFGATRAMADDYGERYDIDRTDVVLDLNEGNVATGDIVLGTWSFSVARTNPAAAFTPATDATPPSLVNAVLVRTGRESFRGNAAELLFGGFLGMDTMNVGTHAVAVGGGPAVEGCVVPLAFASCLLRPNPEDPLDCGRRLDLASDLVDNAGFTSLSTSSASNNEIRELLDTCTGVEIGDMVNLQNGNDLNNPVKEAFDDLFERLGTRTVVAVIIDAGDCDGDAKFNQTHPVVGFAEFTIINVQGPPNQHIEVEFECREGKTDEPAGGGFFGVSAMPRLVR